jgi:hypothetical protein
MSTLKKYYEVWGEQVPVDNSELADVARWIRNSALKESDWTQMPDCPLGPEAKEKWAIYRQQMRDLQFENINLENFLFPDKPE